MQIKLNHPYKCKHCGKPYVILQGFYPWSFLPVEINSEQFKTPSLWEGEWGWAFDKKKHRSHLLDCPALQTQWEDVKKIINAQLKNNEKHSVDSLLR